MENPIACVATPDLRRGVKTKPVFGSFLVHENDFTEIFGFRLQIEDFGLES